MTELRTSEKRSVKIGRIIGRLGNAVCITYQDATAIGIRGKYVLDASPSDNMVWLDRRRLQRQLRRSGLRV